MKNFLEEFYQLLFIEEAEQTYGYIIGSALIVFVIIAVIMAIYLACGENTFTILKWIFNTFIGSLIIEILFLIISLGVKIVNESCD